MIPVDLRIVFAFTAGAGTLFAPCAYPLLPGYVAFFLGREGDENLPIERRLPKAVGVALVVSAGFALVYVALAGVAFALGTRALENVAVLELVVGGLLVVLGAGMAAGRLRPSRLHVRLPQRRRSVLGFFAFGVVYAAAAAGCTAPVFLGIAGVALGSDPATAVGLFGAYALGMSLLMVVVTVLSALGRGAVLRGLSGASARLTRAGGAVLVLAGLAQIYYYLYGVGPLAALGGA